MTKTEMSYLIGFLNELSDHLGNASCNDMCLSDTPENRELVEKAFKYNFPDQDYKLSLYEVRKGQPKKISTCDFFVLEYLIHVLKIENNITEIPDEY